jgi:hypothetical protein
VALTWRRNRVKTLEGPWVWSITKGRMGLIDLGVANLGRQNGVKGHEPPEGSWVCPISGGKMGELSRGSWVWAEWV